jgi:hypothetical protein
MTSDMRHWAGVVVSLIFPVYCTLAQPAFQEAEELLQRLVAAAQAARTSDFLAGLTVDSQEAINSAQASYTGLSAAHSEFLAALEQRFGKSQPQQVMVRRDDFAGIISRLRAVKVLDVKEKTSESMKVVVRLQTLTPTGGVTASEQTVTLKQEGGGWKLQLPMPQQDPEFSARAIQACVVTTQKLRSGAFGDRPSALIALDSAWPHGKGGHQ